MIVGIDLGTTNSLVGVWREGCAELIPNALGSMLTPSAVSIDDDGSVLVGRAAHERLLTHPRQSIAAFKRFMGTDRLFRLGKRSFRAEELSALVLRSLKADAESALGEPVSEAVITVPAYFNDAQRKATRAAGEMAGFKVDRLLNEPTAAALAYGLHVHGGESRIMVLDLGGGTFDVSILEMFEGIMEVRASAGDNFLGGEDFVDVLMDRFIDAVQDEVRLPPRFRPADVHSALRRQAEVAKRALTDRESHCLELVHDGKTLRWMVTRDEFERCSEPLIGRIRSPIERALRDASSHPDQISHLVLAGGATRMPLFRRLIARLFQRLPFSQVHPDEVVASGAAVQAGLKMRDAALLDVVMTDVAPYTLGVEVAKEAAGEIITTGLYMPIIERNTVIPASRVRRVEPIHDRQRQIVVQVFQGESRLTSENIKLGELTVRLPIVRHGRPSVDIRFTYDVSGVLEVETSIEETGATQQMLIEGHPGALSSEEISQRLQELSHLKIHPRDQLGNREVLARAQRLYEERLGDEREMIGNAIDHFRAVLDRQDPREIDAERNELRQWLDTIDYSYF